MRVILLQDIKSLGKRNEVKEVSNGYASNFLIPQGLVEIASDRKVKEIENTNIKNEIKEKKIIEVKEEIIKKINNLSLTFKEKVSEAGHLFAAIGSDKIIAELNKQGVKLDKTHLIIGKPLKEIGEHQVKIKFNNKEASLKIIIEALK